MTAFDDPAHFGRLWAADYDEGANPDPDPAAAFLAALAGDGRALELAIGTGRVALPLATRGVTVEGIEGSPLMVERLRAKPGGEAIPVVIGDLADVSATGPFRLVYLVFNTLFNLVDPDRQAACFRNVAAVLDPGGAFVIEAYVPDPDRFAGGHALDVLAVTEDSATIEVHAHDPATQRILSQKITFGPGGTRLRPHAERYCWPAELDELAERAGLGLAERYAGWDRAPFGPASTGHVSVYRPL
jgi:SAM-dependent methyltransferase